MTVSRGGEHQMGPSDADQRSEEPALMGLVSGRVQGVGFRWFVLQSARRFGIRGDVRNRADGRVEFRCQGSRADLDRFLAAVRHGPPGARVEEMETRPLEGESGLADFAIRR